MSKPQFVYVIYCRLSTASWTRWIASHSVSYGWPGLMSALKTMLRIGALNGLMKSRPEGLLHRCQ